MFKTTNNNPELIERRRKKLEYYLNIVVNDPVLRMYPEVEGIVGKCKRNGDVPGRRTTMSNLGHIIVDVKEEKPRVTQLNKTEGKPLYRNQTAHNLRVPANLQGA